MRLCQAGFQAHLHQRKAENLDALSAVLKDLEGDEMMEETEASLPECFGTGFCTCAAGKETGLCV